MDHGGLDTTRSIGTADPVNTRSRRAARYALREKLWSATAVERFAKCGRTRVAKSRHVEIAHRADVGAYYRGLHLCASVHSCPCCGPSIRAQRATEVDEGLTRWIEAGNSAELLTLTVPHDPGDSLTMLLDALSFGSRRVFGGSGWQDEKQARGVVGMIRALEITDTANGWHPHLHILLVIEGKLSMYHRTALHGFIQDRWVQFITTRGLRAPLGRVGCDLRPVWSHEGVAAYVAKWADEPDSKESWGLGSEMARGDIKRGRVSRHPFQLLEESARDAVARARWQEYEAATKGRAALRWSNGLRARIGLAVAELTDEEILDRDIGGQLVFTLSEREFSFVVRWQGGLAAVLDAAEDEGAEGVGMWLAERNMIDLLRCSTGPPPREEVAA